MPLLFGIMPVSDQGISLDRYMLIPRVLIFVTRRARILLLRGAATKRLWADKYNGVGGHVEPGEDLQTAARRELLEETGLKADVSLCGSVLVETGQNPGIGIFVFIGECAEGEPIPSSEGTLEWVEWDALPSLPCVEDLPILLGHVRRWKPGDPPFAARSFYDPANRLRVEFAE